MQVKSQIRVTSRTLNCGTQVRRGSGNLGVHPLWCAERADMGESASSDSTRTAGMHFECTGLLCAARVRQVPRWPLATREVLGQFSHTLPADRTAINRAGREILVGDNPGHIAIT